MTRPTDALDALIELALRPDLTEFIERAGHLEPADLADVFAALDDDDRVRVVRALPPELSGEALIEMPADEHAEDTLAALDAAEAAEIVDELADDDAADILGELDPEDQARILAEVEHPAEVQRLLRYDPETAGGLMTTEVVTVPVTATAAEAIDEIRRQGEEIEDFYQVFVVDQDRRLVGVLPLKDLVVSPAGREVRSFMTDADIVLGPDMDQEEVARIMGRYNVPSVPVVDPERRLLGLVTFDDVTDVVEEENTEDLLRFGGVSASEELEAGWQDAVRSRLPWLLINLLTAIVAAVVVESNLGTIAKLPILSAWLGIIAGMGGNAGTQSLAVTVRRLALGLITPGDGWTIIRKEAVVGVVNGIANGLVVAMVAVLTGQSAQFGVVVAGAMIGNLLVAGLSGAFIPLMLERFEIDPAIASSIFVTTFTDICGFGLVLLLARFLLLP